MLASICAKGACDGPVGLIVAAQVLTLHVGKKGDLTAIRTLTVALASLVTERLFRRPRTSAIPRTPIVPPILFIGAVADTIYRTRGRMAITVPDVFTVPVSRTKVQENRQQRAESVRHLHKGGLRGYL